MRGLKLHPKRLCYCSPEVASFTGAWIETIDIHAHREKVFVASFTGAWIETCPICRREIYPVSHPLRVRGLKRKRILHNLPGDPSHPLRVRGLKQADPIHIVKIVPSHPLRVRGLKHSDLRYALDRLSRILYGCVD